MTSQPDLGQWLTHEADALFIDAPQGPHLSADRLAAGPTLHSLSPGEQTHLISCAECRWVWRMTLEAAVHHPVRRKSLLWAAVALAAGLGAFLILTRTPEPPKFTARGLDTAVEGPAFSLRGVSVHGVVRDLPNGATVHLSERLGFVYSNADSSAHTLTVLGYDGARIHWYTPANSGEPAETITGGPKSRGTRLPFDIQLSAEHRPGFLTVMAAFDTPPAKVVAHLKAGRKPPSLTTLTLKVVP